MANTPKSVRKESKSLKKVSRAGVAKAVVLTPTNQKYISRQTSKPTKKK